MNARTLLLALLVAGVATAPAVVAPAVLEEEHVHVLISPDSTLLVEVHYSDGEATTKFAFMQTTGPSGSTSGRLSPTPECTDWVGNFTQAAAMLRAKDNVESSVVRIINGGAKAPLAAPTVYTNVPMDLVVTSSSPGGLAGTIATCDSPDGGILKMNLHPVGPLRDRAPPATIRITLEGSS